MNTPHPIRDERDIVLRPHAGQFVIDELLAILMCAAGLVYGGMEAVPLGGAATAGSSCLLLILAYRFACLRRIRYRISGEQLVSESGLLRRRTDYIPYLGINSDNGFKVIKYSISSSVRGRGAVFLGKETS